MCKQRYLLRSVKVPIIPCQLDRPHVVFLIIFSHIKLTFPNVTRRVRNVDEIIFI